MAATYEPIVRLDGSQVATGWSRVDPTALTPVTIEWGASTHYDEVPPAVLTLEIAHPVDPQQTIFKYQNQRVEVWLPARLPDAAPGTIDAERRLFKGTVTGVSWRRILSWDEDTQENEPYWIARITAADSTAAVRGLVPAATGADAPELMYWESKWYEAAGYTPAYRAFTEPGGSWNTLAGFGAAAKTAIDSGHITAVTQRWDNGPLHVFRAGNDNPTVWELIREVYGTVPLAEASYNPSNDNITNTEPSVRPTVSLVYQDGSLTIPTEPVAVGLRSVPAEAFETEDEDFETATDAAYQVGSIAISTRHLKQVPLNVPTYPASTSINISQFPEWPVWKYRQDSKEHVRTVGNGTGGLYRRSLWIATLERPNITPPLIQDATFNNSPTHDQIINRIRDAVGELNGKVMPPPGIFDLERSGHLVHPSVARSLLCTWPRYFNNRPFMLTGALTTAEMGTEAVVQVIGGRLEFSDGWRHTLRWAPLRSTSEPALTIAQIVTNPTATYDQWDEHISWADLRHIDIGAS